MKESSLILRVVLLLLFAPTTAPLCQVLPFYTYTIKDGLIANRISALCQDSRGYLWIGTYEGISVFDGATFQNYTTNDGLALNVVNCIAESQRFPGRMLIATNGGGLSIFDDNHFRTIQIAQSSLANRINVVIEDGKGRLWCGTDDGLFRIENDSVTTILGGGETGYVTNLIETTNGDLWIACNSIYIYSEAQESATKLHLPIARDARAVELYMDADKDIWVGTSDGSIFQFRDRVLRHRQRLMDQKTGDTIPYHLLVDRQDVLWVSTNKGLLRIAKPEFAKGKVIGYTPKNGLPELNAGPLLLDREDNLWIGSLNKGIAKLAERSTYRVPLQSLSEVNGLVDSSGHFWIFSYDQLWEVWRTTNGEWKQRPYTFHHGQRNDPMSDVRIDGNGKLWIFFLKTGIVGYEIVSHPDRPSTLIPKQKLVPGIHLPRGEALCLMIDKDGYLWCSFQPDLLAVVDLHEPARLVKVFHYPEDNIPGSIRVIYQDQKGDLWLGGFGDGLGVLPGADWKRAKIQKYTTLDGLPDNGIRSIGEDERGNLWIGTRHGGMAILQEGRFHLVGIKDGLLSNAIWCMTEDDMGRMWLGTSSGPMWVNPNDFQQYGWNSALLGSKVNSCGVYKNRFVWFVTEQGLIVQDLTQHFPTPVSPPVYISKVMVNGKVCDHQNPLQFSYNQNNVMIEYVGISLKDEKAVRYRYRLKDINQEWSPPTSQRAITYVALRPARYTFEVEAINGEGVRSTQPAVLTFSIRPPFWLEWWFIAAGLAVLGGITTVIIRARVRRLREMERLRTQISRDLHDEVGSGLTRISILSEVALAKARSQGEKDLRTTVLSSPPENAISLTDSLQKVGTTARELHDAISDVVWSLNPKYDSVADIVQRLKSFAMELCEAKNIRLSFQVASEVERLKLNSETMQSILLIMKEAINNAIRHAKCHSIKIHFRLDQQALCFGIQDDGRGFSLQQITQGNGLSNMRKRASLMGGEILISTAEGKGTLVQAVIPR